MNGKKTSCSVDFSDALRVEGVNFKGFGLIYKYVMVDPDLTLEAKTIYAYFCSFAGAGNTAFPSRNKIVKDLAINKDTYYKHFTLLTDQGYITVKRDLSGGKKGRNIYTLVENPKKFFDHFDNDDDTETFSKIILKGIKSFGYGTIPKAVMIDSRLPIKSKGIYAYFCSLTGNGNCAYPKFDQILFQLQLSKNTYYKFYNELLNLNYVTVVQRLIGGKFSVNDYYLNDSPDFNNSLDRTLINLNKNLLIASDNNDNSPIPNISDIDEHVGEQKHSPILNISDIDENPLIQGDLPFPNFSDVKISDIKSSDVKIPDVKISDSNINNSNINSFNNISHSIIPSPTLPLGYPSKTRAERLKDREIRNIVWRELWETSGIPYRYNRDEVKTTAAIHIMTDWDLMYDSFDNEFTQAAYNLFNVALIEMCCAKSIMKLKDNTIMPEMLIKKINGFIEFDNGNDGSLAFISLLKLQEEVLTKYENAAANTKIKNHMKYMQTCIWDVLQVGDIATLADAKRNGYLNNDTNNRNKESE